MMDTALLLLRLVIGLYLAGHGAQKLFGWFGGPGLQGTITGMGSHLGFRPPWLWATTATLAELGGGLLLALGLASPLGPIAIASAMVPAIVVAHWSSGPWGTKGGYELALTNLAAAIALALTGPGRFSFDAVLGFTLPPPVAQGLAVLAALTVLVSVVTRRSPQAQAQPRTA
jgi:putative oxidoreductase